MLKIFVFVAFIATTVCSYAFDQDKAGFIIEVNGESNPYRIFSIFIMPGDRITIKSQSVIAASSDEVRLSKSLEWVGNAPTSPGVYHIEVRDSKDQTMTLNVLVLTPITIKKGEYLNGYRIGNYPAKPLNGNPIYNQPKGLFEVTESNQDMYLTPHFTLKQFVCKQADDFPKYLIVRERLLLKLEFLLQRVNDSGYAVETFGFISGYRTPFYNASIKNVQYSRHVYGGAADIFVDQNKDGSMDDLNKDGKIDDKDVKIFYDIVSSQYDVPSYSKFRGGLGYYKSNTRHNGFIHVDVRGWKARW